MWFEKPGVELAYKILLFEFFIAVMINVVMNLNWSYLVILQVKRVLTRGGADDKSFCQEDEEAAQKEKELENLQKDIAKSDDV